MEPEIIWPITVAAASSGNAHGGKAQKTEDHDRVKNHIDGAADSHKDQGRGHVAGGLQDLFRSDVKKLAEGEQHDNVAVLVAHGTDLTVLCIHADKGRNQKAGENGQDHIMDSGKDHADGRRVIGGLLISGTHVSCNIGIQADTGSHCQGKGKILDREDDGNSGERVAA